MKTTRILAWLRRYEYVPVVAVLFGFVAIALGNIDRWAIWFDEGYTSYLVRFNYTDIAKETANDVHPPLYYWTLKTWTLLFGNHEFALRSLSVILMLVALVGIYVLVRRITHSRRSAFLALCGVALTPIFVHYADEARMYAMAAAIVVWATYVLFRAEHGESKKWWWLYSVLVFAGMFTHYYTAFAWLAHWAWRASEVRRGRIMKFWTKPWIWVHVGAVTAFCFWLPTMIKQAGTVQVAGNGFWIGPITGSTLLDYIGDVTLSFMNNRLNGWWALGAVAITALVVVIVAQKDLWRVRGREAKSPNGVWLLGWLAFLPLGLLILISMPPMRSTFVDRYILYSAMALMALVAIWFSRHLHEKWWRIAGIITVLLLMLGIVNLYRYGSVYNKSTDTATRTRDLIYKINDKDHGDTPIIVPAKWTFYEAADYSTAKHPIYTIDDGQYQWGSLSLIHDLPTGKIKSADLAGYTKAHPQIWVVASGDDVPAPLFPSWKKVKELQYVDPVSHQATYSAALYETQ